MKQEIKFTIPGYAQPQEREGANFTGAHAIFFDRDRTKNYKSYVKYCALRYRPKELLTGALNVAVKIFRKIPKSFSKKKAAEAAAGIVRPDTRPDLKNIIWLIEDALNGLIWVDDAQIVSYDGGGKYYDDGKGERVELIITQI